MTGKINALGSTARWEGGNTIKQIKTWEGEGAKEVMTIS
jgi:hypothetical protein